MIWQANMNRFNKMKISIHRVADTTGTFPFHFYPSVVFVLLLGCCILNTNVIFANQSLPLGNSACPNCRVGRIASMQEAENMIKETILFHLGFNDGRPNVSNFLRPNDLTIYKPYLNNFNPPSQNGMDNDHAVIGAGSNVDDVRIPYIWLSAFQSTVPARSGDKPLLFILDNKVKLIVKSVKIGLYQKSSNCSRVVQISIFKVTPGKALEDMGSHEHNLTKGSQWVIFDLVSVAKYFNRKDTPNHINLIIKAIYLYANSTEDTPLVTKLKKCPSGESKNVEPDCNVPYLVLETEDSDRKRNKRSTVTECNLENPLEGCCRYPLIIDFEKYEWDFIITPRSYQANHCYGKCNYLSKQGNTHTYLAMSANSTNQRVSPCCSPIYMTSLHMLYFNEQGNVVFGELPRMVVEQCGCQ